jgi:hypothetical protein
LIWCKDSNWFAYSLSEGPRVADPNVYHRSGNEFVRLETENLHVDVKGDVRNEYVNPIHWTKPGVLSLEQFDIFRGGNGEDATYQFTAKFDEKTGKFQITSKKKFHLRNSPFCEKIVPASTISVIAALLVFANGPFAFAKPQKKPAGSARKAPIRS